MRASRELVCSICQHPAREHRYHCEHKGCLCQIGIDDLLEGGILDDDE